MNAPSKETLTEIAALCIPEVVLQKCLDRPLGSVLLSRLYAVPSGWETQELQALEGIAVAATAEALEAAFDSQETGKILLLKSAGVTTEALRKRLETQGSPKMIFIES